MGRRDALFAWRRVALCIAGPSVLAATMVGCAMEVGDASELDGDASVAEEELLRARETQSTLTLYSESGLWGDSMSVTITPTTTYEHVRLVTKTEIEGAGLLRRISSLRLQCGTRRSQLTLFDAWNTSTSISQWSDRAAGDIVECQPGERVDVDLHAEGSPLADRVGSIYFVAHARGMRELPFASVVRGAWQQELDGLSGNAEPRGGARLRLWGQNTFRLRQDLQLDHWSCGDRAAHFELQVTMQGNRTFSAIVTDTYVDTGWGDAWGCRERMRDELRASAIDAAHRIATELQPIFELVGTAPRFYFVPLDTTREFFLAYGGQAGRDFDLGQVGELTTVSVASEL